MLKGSKLFIRIIFVTVGFFNPEEEREDLTPASVIGPVELTKLISYLKSGKALCEKIGNSYLSLIQNPH